MGKMKEAVDLIITGTLYVGGNLVEEASLIINRGKVVGIVGSSMLPAFKKHLDMKGAWILPGIVDAHVHCWSNPKEGFLRATEAAAAGGVTTLIDHPLDYPNGIKTVEDLRKKLSLLPGQAYIDVAFLGGLVDSNLDEIDHFMKTGVCGFKILMHDTAPERFSRMHDGPLYEAFRRIKDTHLPAGIHAENDDLIKYLVERSKGTGICDPHAHCETRPPVSELEAVHRALRLALGSGVHLHFYHLSLGEDYEWIDLYRRRGLAVTSETCPHYLLLSEDLMDRFKGYAKINPPLRANGEGERLWKLAAQGKIDLITSDHAPWLPEQKEKNSVFDCSSGSPGVETLFPLTFSEGVRKGKISLERMVQLLSENPAKTFHLYPQKGSLLPGSDADVVIVDPKNGWRVEGQRMHSVSKWTLFEDRMLEGKIVMTLVRGKIIYRDGQILGDPVGRFVSPRSSSEAP
jgi:allantoinase